MEPKVNISTRWENFEPTKKFVFWACVGSVGLTLLIGFNWGGWVMGGTALTMAETAASEARIQIATDSCVARFTRGREAKNRLVELKKTNGWMRGSYLEKAGWATPVGAEYPISGAGDRCAERILSSEDAVTKIRN